MVGAGLHVALGLKVGMNIALTLEAAEMQVLLTG
jgi:hypothetical protein